MIVPKELIHEITKPIHLLDERDWRRNIFKISSISGYLFPFQVHLFLTPQPARHRHLQKIRGGPDNRALAEEKLVVIRVVGWWLPT
jgi:hypothetical protein